MTPSLAMVCITAPICPAEDRAGRCRITLARSPVPVLAGLAERKPHWGSKAKAYFCPTASSSLSAISAERSNCSPGSRPWKRMWSSSLSITVTVPADEIIAAERVTNFSRS